MYFLLDNIMISRAVAKTCRSLHPATSILIFIFSESAERGGEEETASKINAPIMQRSG